MQSRKKRAGFPARVRFAITTLETSGTVWARARRRVSGHQRRSTTRGSWFSPAMLRAGRCLSGKYKSTSIGAQPWPRSFPGGLLRLKMTRRNTSPMCPPGRAYLRMPCCRGIRTGPRLAARLLRFFRLVRCKWRRCRANHYHGRRNPIGLDRRGGDRGRAPHDGGCSRCLNGSLSLIRPVAASSRLS